MFLACAALMSASAFAQVPDVKAMEQNAAALYNEGKALIEKYDGLFAKAQLDPNAATESRVERADALLKGFDILQQALKADSIPEFDKKTGMQKTDKNGNLKFKTKNSKNIINLLSGHFNDIGSIADDCLNARDYANACRGYKYFADMVDSPFAKKNNISLPDSTKGLVRFYEAISAYEVKDFAHAYTAISQALDLKYADPQAVNYFNASLQELAQPKIDAKDYAGAKAIIQGAIDKYPTNPYPFLIMGSVVEQESGIDQAKSFYHKISEIDPSNVFGYFHEGRCIYEAAVKYINDNPNATSHQLAPKVSPMFKEAREFFVKAKGLDKDNSTNATRYIEDIDYKLEQLK